jgi:glycosyltransferase involved in cell wall biosynthesis
MKHTGAKRLLWVKYGTLDTGLDRATWLETGEALRRMGFDVTLVTSFHHAPAEFAGWPAGSIVWLPELPLRFARLVAFDIMAWAAVTRRCLRRPPDYVLVSVPTFATAFPFDLFRRLGLRGPKTVMDLRTFEFGALGPVASRHDRAYRAITRLAFAYGRVAHFGTTAINPRLARAAVAMGARSTVGVWGSGWSAAVAPAAPTAPVAVAASVADSLERMRARFVVMYHGAMTANRGLMEALEAFRLAVTQRPRLMFTLVGDGPQLARLGARVEELGLADDCLLLPPLPHEEVLALVSAASLGYMVYPDIRYWDYNHPIKVAEYLSRGVPILCSPIPMFRDNYPDCEGLIYCSSNAPAAVADSLISCHDDPTDLARRGAAARAFAEDLTWERQAGSLARFLESL